MSKLRLGLTFLVLAYGVGLILLSEAPEHEPLPASVESSVVDRTITLAWQTNLILGEQGPEFSLAVVGRGVDGSQFHVDSGPLRSRSAGTVDLPIPSEPAGPLQVTLNSDHYCLAPGVRTVELDPVELETLELRPSRRIQLVIVDAITEDPVAAAGIYNLQGSSLALTEPEGTAEVWPALHPSARLIVRHPDFHPAAVTITNDSDSQVRLPLIPSSECTEVTLRVYDHQEQLVPDTIVHWRFSPAPVGPGAVPSIAEQAARHVFVNSIQQPWFLREKSNLGIAKLLLALPGTLVIQAQHAEFGAAMESRYDIDSEFLQSPGQLVEVRFSERREIEVRVFGPAGPIAFCPLEVLERVDDDWQLRKGARTNEQGEAIINVPVGAHHILVARPPKAPGMLQPLTQIDSQVTLREPRAVSLRFRLADELAGEERRVDVRDLASDVLWTSVLPNYQGVYVIDQLPGSRGLRLERPVSPGVPVLELAAEQVQSAGEELDLGTIALRLDEN